MIPAPKLLNLCRAMLRTLDRLGRDPMARIDARYWHERYAKRLKKLERLK